MKPDLRTDLVQWLRQWVRSKTGRMIVTRTAVVAVREIEALIEKAGAEAYLVVERRHETTYIHTFENLDQVRNFVIDQCTSSMMVTWEDYDVYPLAGSQLATIALMKGEK